MSVEKHTKDVARNDAFMDVEAFLAPSNAGQFIASDLGNFSLEFTVDTGLDVDEDNERLSDDLDYDESEIERNTLLIPDDDLDGLDDDDLDLLSPKDRQSGASSSDGDSLNDSDSDIASIDAEDKGNGEFFDEERDSFDSRAFESVMSDLNFEFGSDSQPATVIEDSVANPILSPDDEDIEAEVVESSLSSLRRLSIDHSASLQQATGALYKLIWEEGLLGLRLMMTTLFLPAVTKITGKSSMLGIHLVEVGDYLVKIGDQETYRMPFKDVINLLKVVDKPCPLTFRRASDAATTPMDVQSGPGASKNFPWKSAIAQRIAAKIEELQAEEQAREAQAPAVDLDNKYAVHWEEGPLGVSLVANKEVPYPQVTRITGKNRSAQVKDIVPGHYLVSIGNYDTASGTFNAAIKQLHDVQKPAILYFAPDMRQASLRPELGDDEFEQMWEKKQPLGFTLRPTSYGTVVADVGLAKTAKLKQREPTSPSGASLAVGDALIWVNDDCVEDMPFHDALKTLRQAKRPLHLRFRKEHAATNKRSGSFPPPPPPTTKEPHSPKRKEHRDAKKLQQAEAQPMPLAAKLHAALKDAVSPFGKKNVDVSNKHTPEKHVDDRRKKKDRGTDLRSSLVGAHPPATTEKRSFWQSKDKNTTQPPLSAPSGTSSRPTPTATTAQTSSTPGGTGGRFATSPGPDPSPHKGPSRHSPMSNHADSHHQHGEAKRHHYHNSDAPITSTSPNPRRATDPDSKPARNVPFEYEITWIAGEELGVTLKPHPETRRAVVARVSGFNDNAKIVALGDILLAANGIPLPPQQKFKDTLSQLSTMPKPTVLRFLRPARPVFPSSSRPAAPAMTSPKPSGSASLSSEYEIEWPEQARLGLLFSPHPISNAPFVSRMETEGDHLKNVHLGDVLIQLGTLDMRGLKFENCITALTVVSRPVVMRFRRGDILVTPPTGAARPSHQP
ncbi:hypothetical protein LEN26_014728 [Aphanomyces euteiches]|nr:hypothetical protein LEN26_014728 [Aphanomyces euteiches]KAH9113481.1 hypothetical protein AeMF1_012323 [Aphanomyces euteiches]KAH9188227.1 hypothetical protein AeNC1_009793 [Aphanomyces euteiches]